MTEEADVISAESRVIELWTTEKKFLGWLAYDKELGSWPAGIYETKEAALEYALSGKGRPSKLLGPNGLEDIHE